MSEQDTNELSVSEALAGKNLIVIGTTGFLGKVWLAMLLHRYPEIGTVYTVVRSRKTIIQQCTGSDGSCIDRSSVNT